jgi:hypothetical protein
VQAIKSKLITVHVVSQDRQATTVQVPPQTTLERLQRQLNVFWKACPTGMTVQLLVNDNLFHGDVDPTLSLADLGVGDDAVLQASFKGQEIVHTGFLCDPSEMPSRPTVASSDLADSQLGRGKTQKPRNDRSASQKRKLQRKASRTRRHTLKKPIYLDGVPVEASKAKHFTATTSSDSIWL